MPTIASHRSFGLGLVQSKPRKADVEHNLERIREWTRVGKDESVLVFPETAVTGYFLQGGVLETALTAEELAEALGRPEGPDLVIGFYERHRHRLYNSVAWLEAGAEAYRVIHVHRKMFLPTYGVFQEGRFVEAGTELHAFDTRFGRMGLLICEEMWHSLPGTILALDGAEMIVCVSASPARGVAPGTGRPGNLDRWDALAPALALEHGLFVAVCQLVGSEGGKMFPGGSTLVGPDGTVRDRGPLFEEALVRTRVSVDDLERARAEAPLLADLEYALPHLQQALDRAAWSLDPTPDVESRLAWTRAAEPPEATEVREAPSVLPGGPDPDDASVLDIDPLLVESMLVEFIREEVIRRRGFERVVLGLSGGVDSSVSLYLACRALGPDNVFGFRMPYATSSPDSLAHAALVLEATGAHGRTIPITGTVDAYVGEAEPDLSPQRRGNLAARHRAVTLFDQSAKLRALPLGTGNKSERLLGYYTWHADDSPPINPLGDLFKTQVWALARHLGVPAVIVDKPASADLIVGVHDEDELGIGYPEADLILHWLMRGYAPATLVSRGFRSAGVDLVRRRLDSTHWKRELPTVAMLSSTAIGEFYLRPVDY